MNEQPIVIEMASKEEWNYFYKSFDRKDPIHWLGKWFVVTRMSFEYPSLCATAELTPLHRFIPEPLRATQ